MTTEFFPEQTIRYKTGAKRTLVDALQTVFKNHPDELLQRTKVSIEYPKTEVDFPSIVIRFFERSLFNAGVGHEEVLQIYGESDTIEVNTTLNEGGAVQLAWPAIAGAVGYKVYKGTVSDKEDQSFIVLGNTEFIDSGQRGLSEAVPTEVTAQLDPPQPVTTVLPPGGLPPGTYYYRVTALIPSQAVRFKHYFYTADIEFAIYALSSLDRDLVADSLIQTLAMGSLDAYTNTFFERVYPENDLFPDSELHFIDVNTDLIQGFGESEAQTPWGAEDDLLYMTSYRVGVFGELYSLPPKLTYAIVQRIAVFPYSSRFEPVPTGDPNDPAPWVSNDIPQ